jgi:hypothetical protein
MGLRPDIHLHVDELVLHGVSPGDRHGVGAAVGDELSRLLTANGLPSALARGAASGGIDRIDAGSFERSADGPAARPAAVGAQIARAVHRGLLR